MRYSGADFVIIKDLTNSNYSDMVKKYSNKKIQLTHIDEHNKAYGFKGNIFLWVEDDIDHEETLELNNKEGEDIDMGKQKHERHMEICKELNQLYIDKNADYGDSIGKQYSEYGAIMLAIRLEDKLSRFKQLIKNEARVKDESIIDTLRDLANYSLIGVLEMEREFNTSLRENKQIQEKITFTDLKEAIEYTGDKYVVYDGDIEYGKLNKLGTIDLGNIREIVGTADFEGSQLTNLGKLISIGGTADFGNSKVTNLGQLTSIGKNAYFDDNNITNLGQLTSIGRDAYFGNSKITDLGQVASIGGTADFENSQISNLGQLTSIGGTAYFRGSKITKEIIKDIEIKGNIYW